MKQATNVLNVTGILNEVDLEKRQDRNGRNYISGKVIFLVDQTYGDKDEHEEIKEELKSKGDDTWRNYVLNMTKDIVKYEKLRQKIINDDFNFTTVEINDLA